MQQGCRLLPPYRETVGATSGEERDRLQSVWRPRAVRSRRELHELGKWRGGVRDARGERAQQRRRLPPPHR